MSINISEDLQAILIEAGFSAEQRSKTLKIAKEYEDAKKEEKEDGDKSPKSKNKFTVLVRGDKSIVELVQQAWIVQTKEDQDDSTLIDRLKVAVARHNQAAKKQKWHIELWRDAFTFLKSKTTKDPEVMVAIKTKVPVRVLVLEDEKATK